MNDTPNQIRRHPFIRALVGAVIGLAAAAGVMFYGPHLLDMYLASQYTPTSDVAAINSKLQLTNAGETLFYASDPSVESGQAFNANCKSADRTEAILGCYSARQIYVFKVTNPQLDGAEEATAAHELLHAAYDRLNILEKPYVDGLINQEYQKVKNDPTIKQLVSYYNTAEPGALTNELHSIFGTTIQNLSPQLEHYYARYFTDRQAIVAMNQHYTAVFQQVDEQASQISAELSAFKPKVQAELTDYQAAVDQLNADIASFNTNAQSGSYQTAAQLAADRNALVQRISALNAERYNINADVTKYNQLVAEQNALSVTVNDLNSSINAAPAANGI